MLRAGAKGTSVGPQAQHALGASVEKPSPTWCPTCEEAVVPPVLPHGLKARPALAALAAEYQKALSILVRDVSEWMAISSACSRGNVKKQSQRRAARRLTRF